MSRSVLARFEQRPGLSNPRFVSRGAVVIALATLGCTIMFTRGIPFWPSSGVIVKADFTTAENVRPGKTPVRIHGVPVGTVTGVQRRCQGCTGVEVTMSLDNTSGYRLHSDASAHIYWRTLLGYAFYIELSPGSPSAPPLRGVIPIARTTEQVELDQVLQALTPQSRTGIQTTINQLDTGFGDKRAAAATIDRLAPAMHEVGPALAGLRGTEPGDLTTVVTGTNRVLDAFAARDGDLAGLVDSGAAVLGVTAARESEIGATLDEAPATMDQTNATLTRLRTTMNVLDPIVSDLRPGARRVYAAAVSLEPALAQLRPVLDRARPLLGRLGPALARLRSAATQGTPLLNGLMPTVERANQTLIPWAYTTDPNTDLKNFEAIGPTVATVADSSAMYDGTGYFQRFGAADALSPRSASFLPCSVDPFSSHAVNCNDLNTFLGALFGLGVPSPGRSGSR